MRRLLVVVALLSLPTGLACRDHAQRQWPQIMTVGQSAKFVAIGGTPGTGESEIFGTGGPTANQPVCHIRRTDDTAMTAVRR